MMRPVEHRAVSDSVRDEWARQQQRKQQRSDAALATALALTAIAAAVLWGGTFAGVW